MATFTVAGTAPNFPARRQEKGNFSVVATYIATGQAAGSVIQMVKVPLGATVLDVTLFNVALGAGTTVSVGAVGVPAYWISAQSTAAAAITRTNVVTAFPRKPTTEETIDLTTAGGAITGQVTISVRMTCEDTGLT